MPGWLPAVTATLAGLASGGYRLSVPSPWRDEAATVDAAQRSVPQILALLVHQDAVNGAYYLCLHPVILLLGTSPAATVRRRCWRWPPPRGSRRRWDGSWRTGPGFPPPRSPACSLGQAGGEG